MREFKHGFKDDKPWGPDWDEAVVAIRQQVIGSYTEFTWDSKRDRELPLEEALITLQPRTRDTFHAYARYLSRLSGATIRIKGYHIWSNCPLEILEGARHLGLKTFEGMFFAIHGNFGGEEHFES